MPFKTITDLLTLFLVRELQPPRRELSVVTEMLSERRRLREARDRPWMVNSRLGKSASPRVITNMGVIGSSKEAASAAEEESVSDMEWIMGMTARACQEFEDNSVQAEEQRCVRADARWVSASSRGAEEDERGGTRVEARLVPDSRDDQGGIRPPGRLVPESREGEPEDCFVGAQRTWDRLVGAFAGREVKRQGLVSSKPLMQTKPKFTTMQRSIRYRHIARSPPIPPTPKAPRIRTRVKNIPTSQLSVPRLVLPPPPKKIYCHGRLVPPTPPLTAPLPPPKLSKAPVYKSIGTCYREKRKELQRKADGGEEMDLLRRAMTEWYEDESGEEPEEEMEEPSSTSSFWLKESALVAD